MHELKRKRRRTLPLEAACSLCGREIARGERGWYKNGTSVCEECFNSYARAELAPFAIVFGEEDEP